jgi:ornithine cyclodeaminase/alanine dehydrogenase-like protein (mu-crystallin family)
VRILARSDTLGAVALEACVEAVEEAFRAHGLQRTFETRRVHVSALNGGTFHITAGGLATSESDGIVGVKVNGRFPPLAPGQGQRVSGAILLADAAGGTPLALLDSMLVTSLRTAAVTVIVTRLLAREGASRALLLGAGRQARGQVEALALAGIAELAVHDLAPERAAEVATYARNLGLVGRAAGNLADDARASEVIVSVTPASSPILGPAEVAPGTLLVALGADGPGKQELDPRILAGSRVVVDIVEQAAESGELQHALAAGLMTEADVHAELGEVVAGVKPGRVDPLETFVFDGTGTALQDVAAATLILREAEARGLGVELDLAG